MIETSKKPDSVKIDWDKEIIGNSYNTVIEKLGRPISERTYKNGNRVLRYTQQHFWIPHHIGIRNDQVVWVLHKSSELYDNR